MSHVGEDADSGIKEPAKAEQCNALAGFIEGHAVGRGEAHAKGEVAAGNVGSGRHSSLQ